MVEALPLEGEGDVNDAHAALGLAKQQLFRALAPLDRGTAASETDRNKVEELSSSIETLFAKLESAADAAVPIDKRLNGKWRLVYSSTFAGQAGGTQGFTGAPTGGGPLRLGQVYQRVFARRQVVDNIVEIRSPNFFPFSLDATATLSHGLTVMGPKTIQITFDDITVRVGGALKGVRPLSPPQLPEVLSFLRPPASLRSGSFQTTFVDGEARISRGDRGELRIFIRVKEERA